MTSIDIFRQKSKRGELIMNFLLDELILVLVLETNAREIYNFGKLISLISDSAVFKPSGLQNLYPMEKLSLKMELVYHWTKIGQK